MENKKVLIVDDEVSLLEIISDVLKQSGFEVITASNGKEGLEKIRSESPDLILLDCMMDGMNGYEVVEKLRKDPVLSNKPVIMLTVKSAEEDEIKGFKIGVDDYLTKPFKSPVLLARVKAILERKAFSISTNPLTMLPGNVSIRLEVEKRLAVSTPFTAMYLDLTNFKGFNDRYGFEKGDDVIKNTANIIINAVSKYNSSSDFIGHIGGDDFIILTGYHNYTELAQEIIRSFDDMILEHYTPEDKKQGYIITTNRQNQYIKIPIMTIAIGIVSMAQTKIVHYSQLSEILSELKKVAKEYNKSGYAVERRRK